jgi:nucleotide-binding universal stress UspA family protein
LLADARVQAEGVVAHAGPITRAVAEIARDANADLIIVSSSRMGDIGSLFLGSVSFDLLRTTDHPTLASALVPG